jgi:sulfide dehydrogenase cytochrome subunit
MLRQDPVTPILPSKEVLAYNHCRESAKRHAYFRFAVSELHVALKLLRTKINYFRRGYMPRILWVFTLLLAWIGMVSAAHSQTLEATLSGCGLCHGPAGIAQTPDTPHLDKQLRGVIEEAMVAYSESRRITSVPEHRQVRLDLFSGIADFYGSQTGGKRPPQAVDAIKVAQGEVVYNRRCSKCHDDAGRESDNDAPLLAGQNLEYLIKQVASYRDGSRKQPGMMERASRGLSEEEWIATAHFFASQDSVAPAIEKKKRRRAGP